MNERWALTRLREFRAKASNARAAAHQNGCRGEGEGGKSFRQPINSIRYAPDYPESKEKLQSF
jgi:hypothetical protein